MASLQISGMVGVALTSYIVITFGNVVLGIFYSTLQQIFEGFCTQVVRTDNLVSHESLL